MRKYIVWSENPRLENIQVIRLDKKKTFKTTFKTSSSWKKIEINCHKTKIHYQKKFQNDTFSFLKVQNECFFFKTYRFFKRNEKLSFCLKPQTNHFRLARVMKMMKTYKINLLSKLLLIRSFCQSLFITHRMRAFVDKLWGRIFTAFNNIFEH